jgi:hypothetical protein
VTTDALLTPPMQDDGVLERERSDRIESNPMTRCERCGNHYDKAFVVTMDGMSHTFDCFECAINALAPRCAHCNGMIIGHGVETQDRYFCCAHCAAAAGVAGLRDRVGAHD